MVRRQPFRTGRSERRALWKRNDFPAGYPPYVCKRIKLLREKRQLSQKKTARLIGVSQQTYSDYETGRTSIPADIFLDLARLFDVSVDYLTGASNLIEPYPRQ